MTDVNIKACPTQLNRQITPFFWLATTRQSIKAAMHLRRKKGRSFKKDAPQEFSYGCINRHKQNHLSFAITMPPQIAVHRYVPADIVQLTGNLRKEYNMLYFQEMLGI